MASRLHDPVRLVAAARSHEQFEAVSAFARRVLEAVADGRGWSRAIPAVPAMAEELGVGVGVVVDGIRLRSVLERGCSGQDEWAVVVALWLARLDAELAGPDRAAQVRRLCGRLDALEALGADAYPLTEAALSETAHAALLDCIVDLVIEEDGRGRIGRGQAYARVEYLASCDSHAARVAKSRLARRLAGSPLAELLHVSAEADVPKRASGALRPMPRGGFVGALRLVSGWALLTWLARGAAALLGVTRQGTVAVDGRDVRLETVTRFRDSVLRRSEETLDPRALLAEATTSTYPAVHLLAGAVALAAGIVVGGTFLVDGVRSGETYLLLVGAALVLLGGGLDLVAAVVTPRLRGRTALELVIAPSRRITLADVPADAAEDVRHALTSLRR